MRQWGVARWVGVLQGLLSKGLCPLWYFYFLHHDGIEVWAQEIQWLTNTHSFPLQKKKNTQIIQKAINILPININDYLHFHKYKNN